ncbi:MAG: cytochrome P450 [Phototrophicaceae bacterium]
MTLIDTTLNYPPGPATDIIGGHLLSLRRDALGFLTDNMRYGDITHIKFLKYDAYQINHPSLIGQVLTKDNALWHKATVYKTSLKDYLGKGLLNSDGDFWRRQRKLMQPAFHVNRISAYADTMVEYSQAMLANWEDGSVHDIAEDMMQVTLRIVGKTLFDADFQKQSGDVAEALDYMLEDIIDASQTVIHLPEWLPTPSKYRRKQTIDLLNQVVMPIIKARRQQDEDTGDLLSMLLSAKDEDGQGMTDEQVRNESLTLVLAGHETTANALTWTLYLLSQNPDVADKLRAEVDRVLGKRQPTLADLKDLTYTEQVIKEGMRVYPPVWSVARQTQDVTELGGYPIGKYATAIIPIWSVHHDERWYPNSDAFEPERWGDERAEAVPRYAYMPFGGGPRICIGNSFAMMEAQLILASIVQQYHLSHVEGHQVVPEPLVTLRPKHGMKMRLHKR